MQQEATAGGANPLPSGKAAVTAIVVLIIKGIRLIQAQQGGPNVPPVHDKVVGPLTAGSTTRIDSENGSFLQGE